MHVYLKAEAFLQPQLSCGMACAPSKWLVTSHARLHPGPITASIRMFSSARSFPSTDRPCLALQPESATLYPSTGSSVWSAFTVLTASAPAPAIRGPIIQEPVIGNNSAKCKGAAQFSADGSWLEQLTINPCLLLSKTHFSGSQIFFPNDPSTQTDAYFSRPSYDEQHSVLL